VCAPEDELLEVLTEELDWYRDRTMLVQMIKEMARDALIDLIADSIRRRYGEQLRSILNEDVFKKYRSGKSRRLLLDGDDNALMKEAARRAIRREILVHLDLPESVDQLELPWSHG